MSRINSVDGYMDNRSFIFTVMPDRAYSVHEFRISHADGISVHMGSDPLPCDFFDNFHFAIVGFVRISISEGRSHRVCGVAFHMGRQVE